MILLLTFHCNTITMLIMKNKKKTPQARKNRIVIADSDDNIKAFRAAWESLEWTTEAQLGRAVIKALSSGKLIMRPGESKIETKQ